MKAFLSAKGFSQKRLKEKFGHNLVKLLRKSKELGIDDFVKISPAHESEINKANEYYYSKGFEYFQIGVN